MINKKTKQSMITWKLFSSVRFDEEPFFQCLILAKTGVVDFSPVFLSDSSFLFVQKALVNLLANPLKNRLVLVYVTSLFYFIIFICQLG